MLKVVSKYLMSYILPMPLSLTFFLEFLWLNSQLFTTSNIPEGVWGMVFISLILIIELTSVVSLFNYLAYRSSLKYLEKEKAKKIFKGVVILNFFVSAYLIIFCLYRNYNFFG